MYIKSSQSLKFILQSNMNFLSLYKNSILKPQDTLQEQEKSLLASSYHKEHFFDDLFR